MENNARGVRDDLHPQWAGRRIDLHFIKCREEIQGPNPIRLGHAETMVDPRAWRFPLARKRFAERLSGSVLVDDTGAPRPMYRAHADDWFTDVPWVRSGGTSSNAYLGFSRHTCKNGSQDPFLSSESVS